MWAARTSRLVTGLKEPIKISSGPRKRWCDKLRRPERLLMRRIVDRLRGSESLKQFSPNKRILFASLGLFLDDSMNPSHCSAEIVPSNF